MTSTTPNGVRIRKPGCASCRERHLKCDRALPSCHNCRRARHRPKCEYQPSVLKVHQIAFAPASPDPVESRKQTQTSVGDDGSHPDTNGQPDVDEGYLASPKATGSSSLRDGSVTAFSPVTGGGTDLFEILGHDLDGHSGSGENEVPDAFSGPKAAIPASPACSGGPFSPDRMEWPEASWKRNEISLVRTVVPTDTDARVFSLYMNCMGNWIDIVSPARYFGLTVPQIALTDRALYYACLTCASRVLVRRGELDKDKGQEYEDAAISSFIPQLSRIDDPKRQETVLATAVILRMAEQFYEVQEDARCHLVGASSLFTGIPDGPPGQGLGTASFWLFMRQSIRAAFLNEMPCELGMTKTVDLEFGPAAEYVWTNRITLLLARTCSACWDTSLDSLTRESLLDDLRALLDLWRQNLPEVFQPWCEYRAERQTFAVIRYISPWHVTAWQFFYAAKVLVGSYSKPTGVNMITMSRYMEAELLSQCRLLCASTLSCEDVGPRINGTHLVAWCGQFFSQLDERTALIDFLQSFMKETGWPNQTCCDRLHRIWSGESTAWAPQQTR